MTSWFVYSLILNALWVAWLIKDLDWHVRDLTHMIKAARISLVSLVGETNFNFFFHKKHQPESGPEEVTSMCVWVAGWCQTIWVWSDTINISTVPLGGLVSIINHRNVKKELGGIYSADGALFSDSVCHDKSWMQIKPIEQISVWRGAFDSELLVPFIQLNVHFSCTHTSDLKHKHNMTVRIILTSVSQSLGEWAIPSLAGVLCGDWVRDRDWERVEPSSEVSSCSPSAGGWEGVGGWGDREGWGTVQGIEAEGRQHGWVGWEGGGGGGYGRIWDDGSEGWGWGGRD